MADTPTPQAGAWTLTLEGADQTVQHLRLADGEWVIGESADCDVHLQAAGDRRVLLKLAGPEAKVVWPAAQGSADASVSLKDAASWSMGPWQARLHRHTPDQLAPDQPATPAPARLRPSWSAHGPALALASLLLTTSLVTARAWDGSWSPAASDAEGPGEQARGRGHETLSALLQAHQLTALTLEAPATPGAVPTLRGTLGTEEDCQRFTTLRQLIGADRFNDHVACLPEALRSATEFLAGTGVVARLADNHLVLDGRVVDASMRARVATAVNQLKALVPMRLEIEEGVVSAPQQEQATRQIRSRILALHPGNPGHVLMRDGERVFEGGRLQGDLELTHVSEQSFTVRQGGHSIDVTL